MSAGKFVDRNYSTTAGLLVPIRIQPETITEWNPQAAGPLLPGQPSAQVSKGRRSIGINARIARFRWSGAVPDGYDPAGIITLPILTQSSFVALVKNTAYAYNGGTLNLVGKSEEKIR